MNVKEYNDRCRIRLYNGDCMDAMREMEENQYKLAIVDPPYFDGPQKKGYYSGTKQIAKCKNYHVTDDWCVPDEKYIHLLKKRTVNQIIWGCNYYDCVLVGGRIIWMKGAEGSPFSMADIAYHSFYNRIDVFQHLWAGFWKDTTSKNEQRIHPTQKPVALYKWLLSNYAKEGDNILDTHGGSMSIAIACWDLKFDLDLYELDEDYYSAGVKRFEEYIAQEQFDF